MIIIYNLLSHLPLLCEVWLFEELRLYHYLNIHKTDS